MFLMEDLDRNCFKISLYKPIYADAVSYQSTQRLYFSEFFEATEYLKIFQQLSFVFLSRLLGKRKEHQVLHVQW